MTNTTTTEIDSRPGAATISRLAAALNAHERAKVERKPEGNPFVNHDLKAMRGAGLRKSADKHPAINMATRGEQAGYEMEQARFAEIKADKDDKSAKRMAVARARAARKVELDQIADSAVQPSAERMGQAWLIVLHLTPTIDRIANGKRRWASRFLGSTMDDVPQMAKEKTALMLAKSDRDLDVLEQAAQELGAQAERTGQIPGDQLTKDERKERKQVTKARKWLMGVVNNRVMGALVDAYTSERNLRWDNIDLIATVMANINGVGEDPMTARFKADRAPAFQGARFQRPGGVDPALLATAVNAAITERGLDRLVELLLNSTRSDGAIPWSDLAEQVFMADPSGDGAWMWEAVCGATEGRNRDGKTWAMDRARKARGDAARDHVRGLFKWLPGLIVAVVEAFDQHPIAFTVKAGETRATMASDFELFYLGDEPEKRQPLRPVLRFADAGEAAQVLLEHLADLVTGVDLIRSVVNA